VGVFYPGFYPGLFLFVRFAVGGFKMGPGLRRGDGGVRGGEEERMRDEG